MGLIGLDGSDGHRRGKGVHKVDAKGVGKGVRGICKVVSTRGFGEEEGCDVDQASSDGETPDLGWM